MRNIKRSNSPAMARFSTIFKVSILTLCYTSSIIEGVPLQNLVSGSNSTADIDEDTCQTEECKNIASAILKDMDPTVDPCDNFYRYACGGFLNSSIIPGDETGVDKFTAARLKVREQLSKSIETASSLDQSKPNRLLKNLWKSCMNESLIEERGLKPLHALAKKLGGWPVVDGNSWNASQFDWANCTYKIRDVGTNYNAMIEFDVRVDAKNSTKYIIVFRQPYLSPSRKDLLNGFDDKRVSSYYRYMVDIAVLLGAPKNRSMEELRESLNFEIKLANISLPEEEMRNVTKLYNPMSVRELKKNYPSIPWKEYINKMLPASVSVDENEIVNVEAPSFFAALDKLLSRTPKRVLANYLTWKAVMYVVPYVSDEARLKLLEYFKNIYGLTTLTPRFSKCYFFVSMALSSGLNAEYARKYFNPEAKKSVVDMELKIRDQVRRMLTEADWMDKKTRKTALEKLESIAHYVAYPDELLDDNELEKIYKNVEFTENHFIENLHNFIIWISENGFGKLRSTVNKTAWINHASAAEVNAYYVQEENSMEIPAGILQGAFFHKDRPKYLNYGAIGAVIGHELTHAFDDGGSQYDKDGNLADWWEPSTKQKFLERTSCIVNQYNNYTVEDVHLNVNGIVTQGENIGDNGGIKAAYRAYNDWVAKNGPEKKLPGIDRTPKQMLWLSFGHMWCKKMKPEALKSTMMTSVHSPNEFRVVGSLANMPEFAEDYNCPVGSKMNPAKKCTVW